MMPFLQFQVLYTPVDEVIVATNNKDQIIFPILEIYRSNTVIETKNFHK